MRAIVVGGGIGGLAAAVALGRTGWDVTVLEQAAEPGEIGAGISLWPNALTALAALDVWPGIRSAAAMQVGGVRRPDGRWLSRTDPGNAPFEILLVQRGQLWSALRDALPHGALAAGARVDAVTADGVVEWDGHSERADLVVAADGLRSAVRASLVPAFGGARYAGFTAWRGVTAEPFPLDAAAETWGRGAEFGATIMVDGRVYWFATANLPEGARAADEHAEVLRRFGRWHGPVAGIVRATAPGAVLRHDIYTLRTPLPPFAHGRVALLGDAAHAMTPNLGQGACQALEDAVTLAALLENQPLEEAMRAYDQARRPRTEKFVRMSARVGAMLQTENRALIAARNLSARVVPPELAGRGMTKAIRWTPPTSSSDRSA